MWNWFLLRMLWRLIRSMFPVNLPGLNFLKATFFSWKNKKETLQWAKCQYFDKKHFNCEHWFAIWKSKKSFKPTIHIKSIWWGQMNDWASHSKWVFQSKVDYVININNKNCNLNFSWQITMAERHRTRARNERPCAIERASYVSIITVR